MRPLLFAAVAFVSACASPDALVASFNVTTSGTDTQTAPTNSTAQIGGPGTVAITPTKDMTGYVVTFGQDSYSCALKATRAMSAPFTLEFVTGQTCRFGPTTAVSTTATLSVDRESMSIVTFTVAYSYSGTATFINYAGTGTRTYTGPKF